MSALLRPMDWLLRVKLAVHRLYDVAVDASFEGFAAEVRELGTYWLLLNQPPQIEG
jgi:hypothetical protein